MRLDLTDFATFIAVARHKSFRAASAELALSPSAISHAIKQLEQRMKLRLFNRTTRSVSLTEAGESLYQRLRPAFEDIRNILDETNLFRESPIGTLKINVARTAARMFLIKLVTEFTRCYPDIRVEITSDDRLVNIVEQGYDAGIRLNAVVEKDMIAVPIGPELRFCVVATPDYFARHGRPQHPEELVNHQCVVFRYPSKRPYLWEFVGPNGPLNIATNGPIMLDDMDAELDAVRLGAGMGFLFAEQVQCYLDSGELVSVLEDWLPPRPGFALYYPNREYLSCGLRAFLDFIKNSPRNEVPDAPRCY